MTGPERARPNRPGTLTEVTRPQPSTAKPTTTGARIVTALLVASAVVHAVQAVRLRELQPALALLDVVLVLAALAAAAAVLLRTRAATLLAAAVVGGIGVATFLVPGLFAVAAGQTFAGWLDPWAFGALLLDALVTRVAVFTLRRTGHPTG